MRVMPSARKTLGNITQNSHYFFSYRRKYILLVSFEDDADDVQLLLEVLINDGAQEPQRTP